MESQHLPDEDLKALTFARKSILRKNLMITNLQRRQQELKEEVESWKKKCCEKDDLLKRLSPQLIVGENYAETIIDTKDFSSTHEENLNPYDDVQIKDEVCENFDVEPYDKDSQLVGVGQKRTCEESDLESHADISKKSRAYVGNSFPAESSFVTEQFDDYGNENADFENATNLSKEPEQDPFPLAHRFPGETFRLSADANLGTGTYRLGWEPTFRLTMSSPRERDCAICGLEFDSRQDLEAHVRTHTDPEAFACPVDGCGYRTKFAAHLAAHRRTHLTGERSFACLAEGCDYRTASAAHMKLHRRTHTGEKPFACPEEGCGFRARHKGHLSAHRRVHTGERPFACSVEGCGYRTTQSGTLRNHMRTHTGERPFACTAEGCAFRSARRADLTSHILKRHHKTATLSVSGDAYPVAGHSQC